MNRKLEISVGCCLNADGGNNPWNICELAKDDYEHTFEGESFGDVYKQLLDRLHSAAPLYNVVLRIKADYNKFYNGRQMMYRMIFISIMALILR